MDIQGPIFKSLFPNKLLGADLASNFWIPRVEEENPRKY